MTAPSEDDTPPPPGKRQWWLSAFALVLAVGSFFVPQRIPLEWYPLNEPGTDIHYLEIKCASDADGWVTLWYDITHGWSDIEQIRFPISPTEQTYTYTFPLPDAPMIGLRLDPVAKGGTLTVHHMRIINRRGEEIRNFPIESLTPIQGIASIKPLPPGWTITSTKDQTGPICVIEPFAPILPVGMNGRNVHRSLLSTGYLAGMLVILMLAVTSAFWRPSGWRDFLGHVALLATIAIPFSAVGNRGLIRNSMDYARFDPTARVEATVLELTVKADRACNTQIYWDAGSGFAETLSQRRGYVRSPDSQVLRFPLPDGVLQKLRFDPDDRSCSMAIQKIEITRGGKPSIVIPIEPVVPGNQIASITYEDGMIAILTNPDIDDPYVYFSDETTRAVNQAAAGLKIDNL